MRKNLLIVSCMLSLHLSGQTSNVSLETYIENIVESVAEQTEGIVLLEIYAQTLYDYAQQPLNLNTATKTELEGLRMLSDFQVLALLEYRKKQGKLISLNELYYISGFNEEVIQLITPFVSLETSSTDFREAKTPNWKFSRHDIVINVQEKFPLAEGYRTTTDENGQANGPDYLGNALKMQMRYRYRADPLVELGGILEKDAGEVLWNTYGFDYQTAFLSLTPHKTLQKFVVGNYHAQAGQGLLYCTSYNPGKTTYLASMQKRGTSLKGNYSATEANYLRGAGAQLAYKSWQAVFFASTSKRDATIDTSLGIKTFSSIYTAGYHRTKTESDKQNQLNENLLGGSLRLVKNRLQIGWNALYLQYNIPFQPGNEIYKSPWPTGTKYWGTSVDYRFIAGKFQIYGETSHDGQGWATQNTLLAYLDGRTTFSLQHRYYSQKYYAPLSNALAEGSRVNNEQGLFMGIELQPIGGWRVAGFIDVFSFPWLRYQVNSPSQGHEIFIESICQLSNAFEIGLRFKSKQKDENMSPVDESKTASIGSAQRNALRGSFVAEICPSLTAKSRYEYAWYQPENKEIQTGWMVYEDVQFKNERFPLSCTGRLAWFHCPAYDTRIYAYENDLRYSFSVPAYYGIGYKAFILMDYRPAKALHFQFRYAYTHYTDRETISSGAAMIISDAVSEIKFQALIRIN